MFRVRIEHGDDPQADCVVGHRQQKQEVDRRMSGPEYDAGHEPGQGDIGGGGNAPAVGPGAQIAGPAVENPSQEEEEPAGPRTPPSVPNKGLIALGMGFRAPPGSNDWVISLVAMPKKKTMKISLMRKWTVTGLPKILVPSPKMW